MAGKKTIEGKTAVHKAVHDTVQASAGASTRGSEQAIAGPKSNAEAASGAAQGIGEGIGEGVSQDLGQMGGQMGGQMDGQRQQGMDKVMKDAEQLVSFTQGNAEAMLRSGQILTAGMQELSRQMMETAQGQLDQSMAAMRALSGAQSPKDVFELQSSLLRTACEAMLAESGRITECSMKLAEQASAPLTARVTAAMETFSSRG